MAGRAPVHDFSGPTSSWYSGRRRAASRPPLTAARLGHSVLLIEYQRHIGGMAASGLGKSDIEHRELIGGLFREFTERVRDAYVARYGADSDSVRLCD